MQTAYVLESREKGSGSGSGCSFVYWYEAKVDGYGFGILGAKVQSIPICTRPVGCRAGFVLQVRNKVRVGFLSFRERERTRHIQYCLISYLGDLEIDHQIK